MIKNISTSAWIGVSAVLCGVIGTTGVALWASQTQTPERNVYEPDEEEALLSLDIIPQSPNIPNTDCGTLRDYGAIVGNGVRTTQALSDAIQSCSEEGGGRVTIPTGTWEVYPFSLANYVELFFEDGAQLVFGNDLEEYGDPILWRFEGVRTIMTPPLISCVSCHDVAIRGSGVIKGNGALWEDFATNEFWWFETIYNESEEREDVEDRTEYRLPEESLRPEVLGFIRSANIAVEGITIEDAPRSGARILMSTDVEVDSITISTQAQEGDALVLDGSSIVVVRGSVFSSAYGEGMELQSGLNAEGNGMDEYPLSRIRTENVTIPQARNAIALSRAMSGGINRVTVEDVTIGTVETAIAVLIPQDVSGTVSHVAFSDISAKDPRKNLVSVDFAYPDDMVDFKHDERVPATFRNLYFSDISSETPRPISFTHIDHPRVNAWNIFWEGRVIEGLQ